MNADAVNSSVALVGTAGAIGFFLPSLDKAWATNPDDPGIVGLHLRNSEKLYAGVVLSMALAQSLAHKSIFPLLIGVGIVAVVVHMYEGALRSPTS